MQQKKSVKGDLPKLISEAQQMYETEPVAAALMLHDGIIRFENPTVNTTSQDHWYEPTLTHGDEVLRTAFWTMKVMGEDAKAGIAPPTDEWDMNISIAESIARMLERKDDPT